MTNPERRAALAKARNKALAYAEEADLYGGLDISDIDATGHEALVLNANLSMMWARVADALKDGDPAHDSVTTLPGDFDLGVITR